jgi:S1-C subfamily serine protease
LKAQLRILTGARKGLTAVFSGSSIEIGRHPACDFQFDPDHDLDVSARHAVIVSQGENWIVRDLGSLNGTLVNGHQITGDTVLDDTDQVRFGLEGPALEFRLVPDATADGVTDAAPETGSSTVHESAPESPLKNTLGPQVPDQRAKAGTTERIRIEVGRRTKKLRRLTVALFALLLAVVAVFIVDSVSQRQQREAEVAALEARTDSIIRAANDAVAALQGRVEGLDAALRESRVGVESVRVALVDAERSGSADEVTRLRRQLVDASQALLYQQAAAYVDYRSILDANQGAVALMWAEFAPGEVYTGTAFAVRANGTMITARHVVAGPEGTRRPTRIAVKFADSYQVYPARVLALSSDADVAAIAVEVPGGVPTIRGLNQRPDTVRQGDPVAIIGFPLGPDLPMSGYSQDRTVARTSFSAGSVAKSISDVIQIDGYGAQGSSGSPILDQNGEVIGVVYGGQAGSGGRVVLGVPAGKVAELLESGR